MALFCLVNGKTLGVCLRTSVSPRRSTIKIDIPLTVHCAVFVWRENMSRKSNKVSKVSDNCYQNDTKVNSLSAAFTDISATQLNGRYRSKSLSSDKLNQLNADRAAILEDVDTEYLTEKSETPGCLVKNQIMEQESQPTVKGYAKYFFKLS